MSGPGTFFCGSRMMSSFDLEAVVREEIVEAGVVLAPDLRRRRLPRDLHLLRRLEHHAVDEEGDRLALHEELVDDELGALAHRLLGPGDDQRVDVVGDLLALQVGRHRVVEVHVLLERREPAALPLLRPARGRQLALRRGERDLGLLLRQHADALVDLELEPLGRVDLGDGLDVALIRQRDAEVRGADLDLVVRDAPAPHLRHLHLRRPLPRAWSPRPGRWPPT